MLTCVHALTHTHIHSPSSGRIQKELVAEVASGEGALEDGVKGWER